MGHVATVALHDVKLQIQPTQPNHAYDVVEADGVAARFQTRDGGLVKASPASQLRLRQTGALAGFTDQLCTIKRHVVSITYLLFRPRAFRIDTAWVAPGPVAQERARLFEKPRSLRGA